MHQYRSLVKTHVKPVFGDLRLRDLRPSVVQAELDRGALASLSPAMQRKVVSCLGRILKAAARRDKCEYHSFAQLEYDPQAHREARALTVEELYDLAARVDPWYSPDVIFLGITGLRRGELAALLDADVDVRAGSARVYRTLDRFGNIGETKNQSSNRVIELFAHARDAVMQKRELRLAAGLRDEPLLFTTQTGRPISWPNFHRDQWKHAADPWPGLRPHDLRHTAASLMIAAGLEIYFVSAQLGHDSVVTTQRIYTHWLKARNPLMVDRFDRAYTVGADA